MGKNYPEIEASESLNDTPVEDTDELVEAYGNMVYKLAHELHRRMPPHVELDDLIGWGYTGLMEAYRRFDSSRSSRFATFAYYRIRGAMLDAAKRLCALDERRGVAQACNEVLNTYAHVVNAQGAQASVEDRLAMMSDVAGSLSLVYVLRQCPSGTLRPEGAPQKAELVERQTKEKIRQTVARLPSPERTVMEAFYFEDRSLSEIAEDLGYSASWASRIHSRALDRLRGLIEHDKDLDDLRHALPV